MHYIADVQLTVVDFLFSDPVVECNDGRRNQIQKAPQNIEEYYQDVGHVMTEHETHEDDTGDYDKGAEDYVWNHQGQVRTPYDLNASSE